MSLNRDGQANLRLEDSIGNDSRCLRWTLCNPPFGAKRAPKSYHYDAINGNLVPGWMMTEAIGMLFIESVGDARGGA